MDEISRRKEAESERRMSLRHNFIKERLQDLQDVKTETERVIRLTVSIRAFPKQIRIAVIDVRLGYIYDRNKFEI